jgi:hypothetical protein
MGLISWPLGLAGRGIGALGKGIGGARANTLAVAGDLVRRRGSDPLSERDPDFIRATLPGNRSWRASSSGPRCAGSSTSRPKARSCSWATTPAGR